MQFLAVPDDRETIAAQAAAGRLDDGQGHRRGDGGINGVATGKQHAQAGLCSEWLRGADDVAAQHGRTGRGIGIREVHGG